VYDWRELKHWNIPHHLLPETRQIRYQPPGLWETHRNAVLVAGSALTLQSVGIVLLLAARRRARESEASLRLTAEAAKIGLWDHPSDRDDLIEASPEWRDLFDLPRDGPLKTADVLKRIHPDDLEPITQSIENARRHGIGYELEHRVIRADGSTRWISSRGRAEPDSTGRHSRTRGISMDITRRKHAEAELVKQRENLAHLSRVTSLGELSGALAHELNQPLGSILSNAQAALKLLSLEEPRLPDVREILSDIVSEDQRAANVIKRLRALLERGETQPEVFNPHEAFEEVLALTGADLAARGITINRDFGNDIPLITADRVQLQQVFINLISNACEAMAMIPAENKTLNLRTSTHGTDIIIEVRDSGCGFREPAENLFQPFHTTKSKGLGMGLAICQSILTAHHGSIRAESPPEGGAVFLLTLPARHPNP
jgi:PAS domain S-box-containing protein